MSALRREDLSIPQDLPGDHRSPDACYRDLEKWLVRERRELDTWRRELEGRDRELKAVYLKLEEIASRFGMQSLDEVDTYFSQKLLPLVLWQIVAILGPLAGFVIGYCVGLAR